MKSVLTAIGTRPEVIKLAPVLLEINKRKWLENKVCVTRQHTDLLQPFLLSLGVDVNYKFDAPRNEATLQQSAARILEQFGDIFKDANPDLVLVQGDTTTAFIAALSAFYARIPVAHIEAGLRTGRFDSPWPEEAHRCFIDKIATYFFVPTVQAQNTLIAEGVAPQKIWVVGNTSIDAIRLVRNTSSSTINCEGRLIVVTVHRRENHGDPLREICHALRFIGEQFHDVRIMVFLHPNSAVRKPVTDMLSGIANIDLVEPIDHLSFIRLLDKCTFIITDSGGIQEEAPFLGKPVLIVRDTTERPEGIQAGTARLVGTKSTNIIASCKELLENAQTLAAMSKVHFPYGDGYASERIINILEQELREASS